MCFRRCLHAAVFILILGPDLPALATESPLEGAVVRVVSRDPAVLAVSIAFDASRPTRAEIRLPMPGSEPMRAPFRADGANPGRQEARIRLPWAWRAGATTRLELWLDDGSGWSLAGPRMVRAGPPTPAEVPDWAKGVVWYQVFPERCWNANPANDPFAWDRTVLAWDAPFHTVGIEEIEMRWNRRVVEPRAFATDPGRWAGGWGALGQVVFDRRYGGDLQGVVERLDHIGGLGVTGLYLCPVFDARSLHKYDATDHRHIDPTLGDPGTPGSVDRTGEDPLDEATWGWEPGDRYLVDVLLPAARARGMRVILDGVWNHVGRDHFAFRDVLERGRDSVYADWFKVEFDGEGRVLRYDAWDRPNGALPEFRQTPAGDLAPGPKAHVFAVTRRWMDPNGDGDPSDGIDGWRLDVAAEVGRAFWRDWRALVRSINPDAVLIGEIWDDAALWFDGAAFDAQMNYPLAYAIADWLSIGRAGTDAGRFADRARAVLSHAPEHELAQMTLIASHDTERGASLMHNDFARGFDTGATPWRAGSGYDAGPVGDVARGRLLTAFALLTVLPGSPMVYNGDEFAMPGADDPDNRRPIPWADFAGDGPDGGAFAGSVGAVLGLRTDPRFSDLLRFGSFEIDAVDPDRLVVRRVLGDRMLVVGLARAGQPGWPGQPGGWDQIDSGVIIPGEGAAAPVLVWCLLRADTGL